MFGSRPHLGFTEDDLDLSPEATRRRSVLELAARSARYFHWAMAIVLTPIVLALLVQTVLSERANRWTTFWIMMAILAGIAIALELFVVRKQVRQARRSVGVD